MELVIKQREVIKRSETVKKIREMIDHLQEGIKKTTEELEEVTNTLVVHYHKILAEGKDTR